MVATATSEHIGTNKVDVENRETRVHLLERR